jgi:hypothetical protein
VSRVRVTRDLVDGVAANLTRGGRAAFLGALGEEVDDSGRIERGRFIELLADAGSRTAAAAGPVEDENYMAFMAAMGIEVEPPSAEEVAARRQHEAAERRYAAAQESEARALAERERDELAAVDAEWKFWEPYLLGPGA